MSTFERLQKCVFAFNKITDCKQIKIVYCFECTFCSEVKDKYRCLSNSKSEVTGEPKASYTCKVEKTNK